MDPNTSFNSYTPFSILMFESPWTFISAGRYWVSKQLIVGKKKMGDKWFTWLQQWEFCPRELSVERRIKKQEVFHISIYNKDKKIQP
jgi:hypothetical protein